MCGAFGTLAVLVPWLVRLSNDVRELKTALANYTLPQPRCVEHTEQLKALRKEFDEVRHEHGAKLETLMTRVDQLERDAIR
jgi:hypothetical protein